MEIAHTKKTVTNAASQIITVFKRELWSVKCQCPNIANLVKIIFFLALTQSTECLIKKQKIKSSMLSFNQFSSGANLNKADSLHRHMALWEKSSANHVRARNVFEFVVKDIHQRDYDMGQVRVSPFIRFLSVCVGFSQRFRIAERPCELDGQCCLLMRFGEAKLHIACGVRLGCRVSPLLLCDKTFALIQFRLLPSLVLSSTTRNTMIRPEQFTLQTALVPNFR
eukprot:GHVN01041331.1.p1 GENE.GHVN01041331.1~~GHVN01041331.1.p1  ORF type:complete len:224 (+),score=3.73 GHVN01041331.1:354-1025(+)